jgi:Domain of unknown function (DUF929)
MRRAGEVRRAWKSRGMAIAGRQCRTSIVGPAVPGQRNPDGRGRAGMSKATRIRQQNAREKVAAQRAAARRAEVRRRVLITGGSVVAVIAIVVAFILIKVSSSPPPSSSSAAASDAAVVKQITTIPASVLNQAGRGNVSPLIPVQGSPAALTANGKPEMLYIGAEYCPYCAAERWSMAVALSRFGTLSGLHFIHSSATDAYPSTPTLTFHNSTYTSKYLTFTPVEWYTNVANASGTYPTLQVPNAAQMAIFSKYDAPPYVQATDKGSFPFIDIGNKYLLIGAQFLPTALKGMTWSQVAAAMRNPSSAVAKDVNAAANTLTAAICKATGGKPGNVCTSAAVTAGNGGL